jgi:formylglycine-generating enzyme required for sulfatase activity
MREISRLKGGSWDLNAWFTRSANWAWGSCDYRNYDLSFRLLFTKVNKNG